MNDSPRYVDLNANNNNSDIHEVEYNDELLDHSHSSNDVHENNLQKFDALPVAAYGKE